LYRLVRPGESRILPQDSGRRLLWCSEVGRTKQQKSDAVSEMLSLKDVRVTAGSGEIPLLPAKWPQWQERQSGPFLSGAAHETARQISENGVTAKDSNGRAPAEPLLPLPLPSLSPSSFRRARGTLSLQSHHHSASKTPVHAHPSPCSCSDTREGQRHLVPTIILVAKSS
jgi:hypothetical protein